MFSSKKWTSTKLNKLSPLFVKEQCLDLLFNISFPQKMYLEMTDHLTE